MTTRFTDQQVRKFWQQQAIQHGQSPTASWSDTPVIELEIREILKRIRDGQRVADIGCASGYSTVRFAVERDIDIIGVDYIPEMIEHARSRLRDLGPNLLGRVSFEVGDAAALDLPRGHFDTVVVIRVIINLGDWENQKRGLRHCSRLLKPGGTLLLSEATLQGWQRLNDFRREWSLPDIPMPSFNNYLDQEKVVEFLSDESELVEIANFASTYYVGTRVIKPLLAKLVGPELNVADPHLDWNRFCAQLPSYGDYGTQKLFVFRRR